MLKHPALRLGALAVLVGALGFGAGHLIGMGRDGGAAMVAQSAAGDRLLCSDYSGLPEDTGMVLIPAGTTTIGRDDAYPEEARAHEMSISAFWIDRHDVTNAQFARFVAETGYVTSAERAPDLQRHPDLPEAMRVPGSAVFSLPEGGHAGRWRYVAGADWRHPEGPGSDIKGRENHPVTQVAYEDAEAYARWAGRELPTEAQWEYAARGALKGAPYTWGDEIHPAGKTMANTWEGVFPELNTGADGFQRTAPVGCFPPNGYGLYDMAGNVWQWTRTWYRPGHEGATERDPIGPTEAESVDPRHPGTPSKVIKGGSYLCSSDFCMRFRPSARQGREVDSGTGHLGFRTVGVGG